MSADIGLIKAHLLAKDILNVPTLIHNDLH